MKNQHCSNFLEPILAIFRPKKKKKKKKEVHLARRLRGNWTYKSQSIFSRELERSHQKAFWIQIFLKVTQNSMISGLWKILTMFLLETIPSNKYELLYSDFPYQGASVMCAHITIELVEISEAWSCNLQQSSQ